MLGCTVPIWRLERAQRILRSLERLAALLQLDPLELLADSPSRARRNRYRRSDN